MNKLRGETEIAVGDDKLPLRFSMNSMAILENRLGAIVPEVKTVEDFFQDSVLKNVRCLRECFIVGAMTADKDLKQEDAYDMFADVSCSFADLVDTLTLGMASCLQNKSISELLADRDKATSKKKRRGTGAKSSEPEQNAA